MGESGTTEQQTSITPERIKLEGSFPSPILDASDVSPFKDSLKQATKPGMRDRFARWFTHLALALGVTTSAQGPQIIGAVNLSDNKPSSETTQSIKSSQEINVSPDIKLAIDAVEAKRKANQLRFPTPTPNHEEQALRQRNLTPQSTLPPAESGLSEK